jgi:uncharacterized protein
VGPDRHTSIFAKRPDPGAVKTRLVPPLFPAQAADLARCMVLDGAERLLRWDREEPLGPALAYAPADGRAWFEAHCPPGLELLEQRGADLGARLAAHFERVARERPGSTVVVLGADAPLLPRSTVLAAHRALAEGVQVVLAPDQGGGYSLVGLREPVPQLFTAVPMSSLGMGARTVALARELGLSCALLEPAPDVDLPADLELLARLIDQLAPDDPDRPPRTAAWLRSWERGE